MTPRSLFTVIVKIIGLIMITSFTLYLGQFFNVIYNFFLSNYDDDQFYIYSVIVLIAFCFLFYKILRFVFFKTNVIVSKLKLAEHFEEENFNLIFEPKIIFRYSIIIVGVVIFYNSIFDFITEISNYFSVLKNQTSYTQKPLKIYFIIEFVKIIIGYLFIFNSQFISNYILKKQVEINEENITEDVQ